MRKYKPLVFPVQFLYSRTYTGNNRYTSCSMYISLGFKSVWKCDVASFSCYLRLLLYIVEQFLRHFLRPNAFLLQNPNRYFFPIYLFYIIHIRNQLPDVGTCKNKKQKTVLRMSYRKSGILKLYKLPDKIIILCIYSSVIPFTHAKLQNPDGFNGFDEVLNVYTTSRVYIYLYIIQIYTAHILL